MALTGDVANVFANPVTVEEWRIEILSRGALEAEDKDRVLAEVKLMVERIPRERVEYGQNFREFLRDWTAHCLQISPEMVEYVWGWRETWT